MGVGAVWEELDNDAWDAFGGVGVAVGVGVEVDEVADADEEGVETLGGLLAKRLGRVPIPGARITVHGWDLTAESAAGRRNRIGTVLAEPVARPDDDEEDGDDQSR